MTDVRIYEVGIEPTPFSHSAEGRGSGATEVPQIRVGGQSDAGSTAGAITEALKRFRSCEVTMIGAPSINQGVKALAISRGHLACLGLDLILRPAFFNTEIQGKEMTGMKFTATVQPL
jgi:stage V sporulation protein SpoVS